MDLVPFHVLVLERGGDDLPVSTHYCSVQVILAVAGKPYLAEVNILSNMNTGLEVRQMGSGREKEATNYLFENHEHYVKI